MERIIHSYRLLIKICKIKCEQIIVFIDIEAPLVGAFLFHLNGGDFSYIYSSFLKTELNYK